MIGFDSLIDCFDIKNFSETLHTYLENQKLHSSYETEIYSLDRVENDIGILENRYTGELLKVPAKQLDENLKDGDIFKYFEGAFEKDEDLYSKILNNIDTLRKNTTIKP